MFEHWTYFYHCRPLLLAREALRQRGTRPGPDMALQGGTWGRLGPDEAWPKSTARAATPADTAGGVTPLVRAASLVLVREMSASIACFAYFALPTRNRKT